MPVVQLLNQGLVVPIQGLLPTLPISMQILKPLLSFKHKTTVFSVCYMKLLNACISKRITEIRTNPGSIMSCP